MYPDLPDIVYENNLDTAGFARIFKTTAQSYKFYWFEAILNLARESDRDLSFGEIVDEMICDAWHTVTFYHLRLGPTIRGKAENFLERAIATLRRNSPDLPPDPSAENLKAAIGRSGAELRRIRTNLTNCVPYKLLYPFLSVPGLEEGLDSSEARPPHAPHRIHFKTARRP